MRKWAEDRHKASGKQTGERRKTSRGRAEEGGSLGREMELLTMKTDKEDGMAVWADGMANKQDD